MPLTARIALFGASVATGACYAYRPVAQAPTAESRVRIVFASALTVTTLTIGGDDSLRTYPGVFEASGIIQAAAKDTIALRLGELRTAAGSVPNVSAQVAMLPTATIARIEQRRFQAGTTILVGVGISALALAAYVIVLIVAITKGF